jgi:hypothetical protein
MSSHAAVQYDAPPEALSAPAEILVNVAHELRQPLSNIETIAYYLSMVVPPGDTKIQAQLGRIRELVQQSSWILSSGASLAGCAPTARQPQPMDLEEMITESVSSCGSRAPVRLALSGDLPLVRLDPREGRDLVDSLLMLFRTMADGAGPIAVTTSARPEGGVLMEIQTSGSCCQGVSGAGSELAIESARRVAQSHGGAFQVDAGPDGGIRGRLMLP